MQCPRQRPQGLTARRRREPGEPCIPPSADVRSGRTRASSPRAHEGGLRDARLAWFWYPARRHHAGPV